MADRNARDRQVEPWLRQVWSEGTSSSPACLDAEQLAAWVDGGLRADEAESVERHLADCASCQAMLAVFAEAESVAPPEISAVVPFWSRWRLPWLAPLAAASLVVLVWLAATRDRVAAPDITTMARIEQRAGEPAPQTSFAPESSTPASPAPQASAPSASLTPPVAEAPGAGAEASAPAPAADSVASMAPASARARDAADAARAKAAEEPTRLARAPESAMAPPPPPAPPQATAPVRVGDADRALGRAYSTAMRIEAPGDVPQHAAVSSTAPAVFGAPQPEPGAGVVRWRITPDGRLERHAGDGQLWLAVALPGSVVVTAGSAPLARVVWLGGRGGVVLRSTDLVTFEPRPTPTTAAIVAIEAADAARARVVAADGRQFSTTDGGLTWTPMP